MITTTMIKQLRIFEVIIICILANSVYGKSLDKAKNLINVKEDERVKRGYSHYGGNDFGSSVHVSSGILQYSGSDEHSASFGSSSLPAISLGHSEILDTSTHLESSASNADSWAAAGLSPGYDVWLKSLPDYQGTSVLDSSTSITSKHPASDHIANSVFSDDMTHSANFALPSSQLHTQIGSSSISNSAADIGSSSHDHGALVISDNIDFNNDADINIKHYPKSYGK